jgi:hypothetical protein
VSHSESEPKRVPLHKVIMVSPSERMKLKSALKKWISANAGLSGVKVDSTHRKIRQELGRPDLVQQCNIVKE